MAHAAALAAAPTAPPPAAGRPFFAHLHAFRGLAVAVIVAAHCTFPLYMAGGGQERATPGRVAVEAVAETLFHDSTIFFALISGLLYSLVLAGRGWGAFFRGKLLHVALPYALISLLYVSLGVNLADDDLAATIAARWAQGLPVGGAVFHLWYIPVLLVLFALTPAVAAIVRAPVTRPLLVAIVLAPLVVSRVWPQFSPATVVYFLGAYTAGVWAGAHYEAALALAARHRAALAAVALATSAALLWLYTIDFQFLGPVDLRETLFYPQKLAIAALALLWLRAREPAPPRLLLRLGDYAFPIYFLHIIPVFVAFSLVEPQIAAPLPAALIALGGLALLGVALAASWALARGFHALLGRRSRYLVGA